jgi:hypothetical protein
MRDLQTAIDSYDIDVLAGIRPELALAHTFRDFGINQKVLEHHVHSAYAHGLPSWDIFDACRLLVTELAMSYAMYEMDLEWINENDVFSELKKSWMLPFDYDVADSAFEMIEPTIFELFVLYFGGKR